MRQETPMPQRILIVDDDPNALRLISYALRRDGYETLTAPSGADALRLLDEEPVDLMVLDLMMPQMDGLEVCRRVRENPRTARLPIIMLTAKSQVEDRIKGFQVGADDYLTKPALPAELLVRIRALLARTVTLAGGSSEQKTRTITFLGVKGGVGTTTVATNVALALAQADRSIVLADLNLAAGSVAWLLGLQPRECVLPTLKEADRKPTTRLITACLVAHSSGLRVFPAPSRAQTVNLALSPARIKLLVGELGSQCECLIIDAGSTLSPVATTVLANSDRIAIVLDTDDLSIELAQQTVQALRQIELRAALVDVVMVNRNRGAAVISKVEAEQRLNARVTSFITPAPELSFQAIRTHTPIMLAHPGNLTVEQLRELATHLAG
jgi:DNA-binding response OmpR family regulator